MASYANQKLEVTITAKKLYDKIKNKIIEHVRLVQRIAINAPMRNSELMQVEGTKKDRERPKIVVEVINK